jgi:alpha-tubulin suppressor-like RCC1 family protein
MQTISTLNISQVSAGYIHSHVLTDNGTAFGFGYNGVCELGLSFCTSTPTRTPTQLDFFNRMKLKQISGGYQLTLFLTNDGKVYRTNSSVGP